VLGNCNILKKRPVKPIATAKQMLQTCTLENWEVCCIASPTCKVRSLSVTQIIDMAIAYVQKYKALFESCDVVVIEQQPKPKMMNVAVAIYSTLRCINPSAIIVFQNPIKKLAWGSEMQGVDLSTYYKRKKGAVTLTKDLLVDCAHQDIFDTSKKKDDLADSFLHALAYCIL
jgi:hypothetical protein